MNNKFIGILVVVLLALIAGALYFKPTAGPTAGSYVNGSTARYVTATSTVVNIPANVTQMIISTSTSRNRDYLFFQALSGDVYCSMLRGAAASMTSFSFTIGSSTPTFSMVHGIYNGAVQCIATKAGALVVTEANI